jgi:glucose-6-phosphate isomerase
VAQIEALMHFLDYPLLFITAKGSTLDQIGQKAGAHFVEHPDIGGRYTAFTNVGMVPAALCGIDVAALWSGAQRVYSQYANPKNSAMRAAQAMWALEQAGTVDVFMPFYSHALFSVSNLIVQLCHESFGKAGLGQTYFAHEAPESQHHTNQRFFGGRKNIAGFFVHLENFRTDARTSVPAAMHSIHIRDGSLFEINKLPLSFSMEAEFRGTLEDAKVHGIPCVVQNVLSLDAAHVGELVAFWQLYAVYSAVLRGVDPFDQPQVEASKKISWTKRKAYHEHA